MEFVIFLEERISSSSKSGKRLSFLTPSAPGNQGSRKLSGNIQRSFCWRKVISPSQTTATGGCSVFELRSRTRTENTPFIAGIMSVRRSLSSLPQTSGPRWNGKLWRTHNPAHWCVPPLHQPPSHVVGGRPRRPKLRVRDTEDGVPTRFVVSKSEKLPYLPPNKG